VASRHTVECRRLFLKTPDIPKDERDRLETLRSFHILDTPAEERFDRLTRITKRMFGVPIALVSLIDENRQWFKSCVGLGVSETSREISFCGHAILGDNVFVIPDAKSDDRFADNPLVTNDPHIRFYAGCPLSAPNGRKLGTLCVIDREPRNFERDDIEALQDLASMVEREITVVEMATLDELTNIPNRRGFIPLAQQSLRLCARQGVRAALVFLDLDKFKPINDTFGHEEGDRALAAFAQLMKRTYRDSDLMARLGGDEFVVLLTSASRQIAGEVVARFGHLLETYNREVNRGYDITFSHGIAEFDDKIHNTIEELMAEGDALMYEAKKSRTR
jgi:diguanylate cyclase (GGDEF)-like protein